MRAAKTAMPEDGRNVTMPKVLIFAVYFGTLPEYFQLWLNACRFNPKLDWCVITDAEMSGYAIPTNVHVVPSSIAEISARFEQALGRPVDIRKPYKICDFRPLFGCLVDLVPGAWEFWGHCDLDMIFGDVTCWLTPELLGGNDKIFGVGHLTVYRNDQATNEFYRRPFPGLDFERILTDHQHHGFDEHIGVNLIWKHHKGRFHEDETILADIDPHIRQFICTGNYIQVRNYRKQVFCFDKGAVRRLYWSGGRVQAEDFMYIHFQKRKFSLPPLSADCDRFYITPEGFVPMRDDEPSNLSSARIRFLNPAPLIPPLQEASYRLKRQLRLRRILRKARREVLE